MGGVVTLKSIETYPNRYSAAVPMCTSAGGTTVTFDHKLDYALAYDVAFGWPESWGTVADIRDDIDFWSDVWNAKVMPEIFTPSNHPKWEFIRRVTGTPEGGYYGYAGPVAMPPAVIAMSYFITEQRAELEMRAGGVLSQNLGRVYSLSEGDTTELEGLGIPVEAWLAEMNDRTSYRADPNARNYLKRYADYAGKIKIPVMLVHNVEDSITPVKHTTAYLETVEAEGNEDLLVRVYSDLPGHCHFTLDQMLTLFDATVGWLESGTPPAPDDFPATLDFAPGYTPEP
jgi:pimeloyl-ACP methyl ester carboxylesterase